MKSRSASRDAQAVVVRHLRRGSVALLTMLTLAGIAQAADSEAEPAALRIAAPGASASHCTSNDFGAMQIRIGLHASLQACFRNVAIRDDHGTAFVTIPREFEDRPVTREEFDALRADIVKTENAQYEASRHTRDNPPGTDQRARPLPLGIFDYDEDRVGYAYAYAVSRLNNQGEPTAQPMMRLESFVLVGDQIIVLMVIAPVRDGDDAADTFDLSEQWARTIINDNRQRTMDTVTDKPARARQHSGASGQPALTRR